MNTLRVPVLLFAALTLAASTASADPLVKMDGKTAKPGVVTAWSGDGKKVELTLAAGADANQVAAAIQGNVDRVKAKVTAGKVLVIGKTLDELLPDLAKVNVGGDDMDAIASAGLDSEELGSGSSLRAKKKAKDSAHFKDRSKVALATVVSVDGAFPDAIVVARIMRGPTGALGEKVRKGQTIKLRPALKKSGATLDLADELTQINLGAWYLEKGDRVEVRIGAESGGVYTAEALTR